MAIGMLDTDVADPSAATVVEEGLAAAMVGEGAGGVVTAVELGYGKQQCWWRQCV